VAQGTAPAVAVLTARMHQPIRGLPAV